MVDTFLLKVYFKCKCSIETYEFNKIGQVLYDNFQQFGYNPTRKNMRYCTTKIASFFIPEAKAVLYHWGKNVKVSNEKAQKVLKIKFNDIDQTIVDMGNSLIDVGIVPDYRK